MLEVFKHRLAEAISSVVGLDAEEVLRFIRVSSHADYDLECRIAFVLAKERKTDPQTIAQEIASSLPWEAEAVNGYVNVRLPEEFYQSVIKYEPSFERKGRVIVEFPSVNPNKPLHIGHLRNALLGDSLRRILRYVGYDVISMDYIDDLGLQVAQSLWGYINLSSRVEGKFDHWLGEQYVEVHRRFEEDPSVQEEVRRYMKLMEEGSGEIADRARRLAEECVRAQHRTLQDYGVFHDVLVWESDIVRAGLLGKAMDILRGKKILVPGEGKYEGCEVVPLSHVEAFKGMKEADKVFIRADGTATYTAKDVAFQMWKLGMLDVDIPFKPFMTQDDGSVCFSSSKEGERRDYRAEAVINIIGVEQSYPQRVIREVLRWAGLDSADERYIHVAYNHARLKEGKFSGRKGTWRGYTADDLLREGISKAYKVLEGRDLNDEERKGIARAVGLGAIRFSFLRMSPEKELVFDWDRALSLEGDSGPYLQYSYARALRILEKAEGKTTNVFRLTSDHERRLLFRISLLEEVVLSAARNARPHLVVDYSLTLAELFNRFYTNCRVIGEPADIQSTRLSIVEKFIKTMGTCLDLLGIPRINKM